MNGNSADSPSAAAARPPSTLALLRDATRDEHAAIEQSLDLARDTLTPAGYQRILERFYGYYSPLEPQLFAAAGAFADALDLAHREKTSLLARDLRTLGVDPATLARCNDLPRLDSPARALGCMYVIEGSSLGGQLISREVRKHLGITPDAGGAFFAGYGELTGARWKAFGAVLNAAVVTAEDRGCAVEAAIATFETLRAWCAR